MHIAQERHRPLHPAFGAGFAKLPQPGDQVAVQTRFDIKGALRIEHPSQALTDDTRFGQRHAVAGHYQPGITIGTARADLVFFDQGHIAALLLQKIRAADPGNPGTDEQYIYFLRHSMSPIFSAQWAGIDAEGRIDYLFWLILYCEKPG